MEVAEEVSYKSLTETNKDMIDAFVKASLVDTPLADPSGATALSEVTLGTLPISRLMHRERMPRQMDTLSRHDYFFTSLSVLLYFDFWIFICLLLRKINLCVVG